MKFKAEKNKLSEAVQSASKACAPKTAFNALDGVLLNLSGDKLTVTGYDLEMGIKVSIKVDGLEDGEIVIDSHLFGDMVRRMPADVPVEVEVKDEKEVFLRSGKIKLNMQGTSGSNFPNIIELNDNVNFKIKEGMLKNMLSQVSHAIAQTDLKPVLRGVKFDVTGGILRIVASDGVRMALREEKTEFTDIDFIVPEKTVTELVRNLSEDNAESDVTVTIDRNQVSLSKENYMIFSRLLDGKFIDYQRVMDFVHKKEVVVKTREFISSLERSLLLITDRFKSPVVCVFRNEAVQITCKTNLGNFEEELGITYKNADGSDDKEEQFNIAFNPKFMIDALKNSNCDEVKLLLLSEFNPIKILSMSGEGFVFVVVPVRIK